MSKTRALKRQTSGRLRVPKMAVESAESLPVIGPILGDFGSLGLQDHDCERIPTKETEQMSIPKVSDDPERRHVFTTAGGSRDLQKS